MSRHSAERVQIALENLLAVREVFHLQIVYGPYSRGFDPVRAYQQDCQVVAENHVDTLAAYHVSAAAPGAADQALYKLLTSVNPQDKESGREIVTACLRTAAVELNIALVATVPPLTEVFGIPIFATDFEHPGGVMKAAIGRMILQDRDRGHAQAMARDAGY